MPKNKEWKFESAQLNLATMVKAVHDLDCVVCPFLKVKGGHGHLVVRCHHPGLCVPVRIKIQKGKVFSWCPRRKALEEELRKHGN